MDQHVLHGQEVWPQISEHMSQLYLFLEKKNCDRHSVAYLQKEYNEAVKRGREGREHSVLRSSGLKAIRNCICKRTTI